MTLDDVRYLFLRRWWVVLLVLLVAEAGAMAYAFHQTRIYQASGTAFVHPVISPSQSGNASSDIQVLAYSTFTQTFISFAESPSLLQHVARTHGVGGINLADYAATASALPGSTVIQVSVQGPNSADDVILADGVIDRVNRLISRYYPVYALSRLDRATASKTPVQPRLQRDVLYAGGAGVLLGLVLALLTLEPRSAQETRLPRVGQPDSEHITGITRQA